MVLVARDVGAGGFDHTLLLAITHGIFGWSFRTAGFHFHKDEAVTVPGNQVDFAGTNPLTGRNDAETKRAQIIGTIDFGTSSE